MSGGLKTPWTRPFGDPEALPIMSARVADIVRVPDADVAADRWEFELPSGTLAFELTALNAGDDTARITYWAGPDLHSAIGGIIRPVPAGGALVEFRHAIAGDIVVVEDGGNDALEVVVHAHIGG
ncbi:hypothetical protein [Devosia faecipullorum]|uniref:hypothetical protein n=1 Tax=Devosia faecipullorum TaxID=2755039 RepID=UPI00187B3E64|nr:hypothetical protein [Devosia faecipullorum]MBE7732170.1 hypothetical protein [Devosia faecipullorum]